MARYKASELSDKKFKELAKDTRYHAEAVCPECGELTTRPLAHLWFTHNWQREDARKWVRENADMVTRRG